MKVVLDTNIILASVSPFSPYRAVFDKFDEGPQQLANMAYEHWRAQNR